MKSNSHRRNFFAGSVMVPSFANEHLKNEQKNL